MGTYNGSFCGKNEKLGVNYTDIAKCDDEFFIVMLFVDFLASIQQFKVIDYFE